MKKNTVKILNNKMRYEKRLSYYIRIGYYIHGFYNINKKPNFI